MPTDFTYQPPQPRLPNPTGSDAVGSLGAGIRDGGAHGGGRAEQEQVPSFPRLVTRSEELDTAEAARTLNIDSSQHLVGPGGGGLVSNRTPGNPQQLTHASPPSHVFRAGASPNIQQQLRGIDQSLDQLAMNELGSFAGGAQNAESAAAGEELSFYALDIASITDLIQQQNLLQY